MPLYLTRRVGESFSVYDRAGIRWVRVRVVDRPAPFRDPELRLELDGYTIQAPRACAIYDGAGDRWLCVTIEHGGSEPLLKVEAPRLLTIKRDDGRPPPAEMAAAA